MDNKYAAIDIGSNAVRLLIEEVLEVGEDDFYFKKISLTRVPIRLGTDAFAEGLIKSDNEKKLYKCMKAFKYLMDINGVTQYRACATSAMREAKNSKEIRSKILEKTGIDIEEITGREEAKLILDNFHLAKFDTSKTYLYIDVGGGSTEVSLIKNGRKVDSNSFRLGTVRLLKENFDDSIWTESQNWVKELVQNESEIVAIGTGGNINRIYKDSRHQFGEMISYVEIRNIVDYIEGFSFEERIKKLQLKPDRADVIVPAGKIYLHFMKAAFAQEMIVPKVGLSDGIIYNLYMNDKKAASAK